MARITTAPCRIKAAGVADGLKAGEFEAIVSVFGNVDSYGDVMLPGSFSKTLADWAAKGDPIPVIWSHDWNDPQSHIGIVLEAREVAAGEIAPNSPAGLYVRGQLDTEPGSRALQVSRLLAGRRVTQFSFAYDEIAGGPITLDGERAWGVQEVALFEVGPTLLGANQETTLIGAKKFLAEWADRHKSGARHSADDMQTLRGIHDALKALGVPCESDNQDGKSRPDVGTDVDADGRKAEDVGQGPVIPAQRGAGLSVTSVSTQLELLLAGIDIP